MLLVWHSGLKSMLSSVNVVAGSLQKLAGPRTKSSVPCKADAAVEEEADRVKTGSRGERGAGEKHS